MNLEELLYKAKDIMSKNVVKVFTHDNVKYVCNLMVKNNLDETIVINEVNKLEGIFTRNDLAEVERIFAKKEISLYSMKRL